MALGKNNSLVNTTPEARARATPGQGAHKIQKQTDDKTVASSTPPHDHPHSCRAPLNVEEAALRLLHKN